MTDTYVAIDVETTGLDPEVDRITEVAAVRFRADGEIIETFEQLVNPCRPIPPFVERLTGVTEAAVQAAPKIGEVLPDLQRFAEADPLVGHNVQFDLAHLRSAGFEPAGPAIDTAELSRILMPDRQSRGLSDLAARLGVTPEGAHRAGVDARTTAAVFVALLRQADALPVTERLSLARLTATRDEALARVIGGSDGVEGAGAPPLPSVRPGRAQAALARIEPRRAVSKGQLTAAFGAAEGAMERFEARGEQREMAEAVRQGFSEGGHWLIEAGTGVGKSLAYLLPAAIFAVLNGERVVISTNTINLQEQLLGRDIPAVRTILAKAGIIGEESDLRVALLKGRGNYLCLNRWFASYTSSAVDPDFAHLASSMLLWLERTETGDRAELNLAHTDYVTWQRVSAQDADCLSRQNHFVREGSCFLLRSRQAAEAAHLVIVNHALLLADVMSGGSAIPPFGHLVVDEAHNLEDVATQQLGMSQGRRSLDDMLDALHRPAGREGREGGVVRLLRGLGGAVQAGAKDLEEAVERARAAVVPFCQALGHDLRTVDNEDERLLVTPAVRGRESWTKVEERWATLSSRLREAVRRAGGAASLTRSGGSEQEQALASEVDVAARRLEEAWTAMEPIIATPSDETITWVSRDREGLGVLNAAPLEVGPRLWQGLWSEKDTVIATSATLSAAGSMAYATQRLGFERPETLQLGSPFDYRRSTMLATLTDVPEPNRPGYATSVAQAVVRLVTASEGRALALFTSHAALREASALVRERLRQAGIIALAQGVDGTPRQLIDRLRADPKTVVLGTSSFWEGVDVRGEALSMLIICRLPFSVPTDPIHLARSEQYENPFEQYSLPSAILRFRQGFGRLIRSREDRGVVVVLDARMTSKRYGRLFSEALPECTRVRGTTEKVAEGAATWLKLKR